MVFFRKSKPDWEVCVTFDADRQYYEVFYQNWLTYQSCLKRYALPLSLTCAAAAVIAIIALPNFRPISGGLLVAAILYTVDAGTHQRRWLKQRTKSLSIGKSITLVFKEEEVYMETPNSNGNLKYAAFEKASVTQMGIFLIPENGMSIFTPKSAFPSDEEFKAVSKKLSDAIP